mgnify:CR=1 FL=1
MERAGKRREPDGKLYMRFVPKSGCAPLEQVMAQVLQMMELAFQILRRKYAENVIHFTGRAILDGGPCLCTIFPRLVDQRRRHRFPNAIGKRFHGQLGRVHQVRHGSR